MARIDGGFGAGEAVVSAQNGGIPASVTLLDRAANQHWLSTQPREVSLALAARSSLRVLPVLVYDHGQKDFLASVMLPLFRAAAVLFAAAKSPSTLIDLRGAPRAVGAAVDGIPTQNTSAARVAIATTRQALSVVQAAAENGPIVDLTAAVLATAAEISACAEGTLADIAAIESSETFDNRAARAIWLLGEPLWWREIPHEMIQRWFQLNEILLRSDDNWPVWSFWYDHRLQGTTPRGTIFDIAVARLADELWKQGPRVVNARIAELLENHAPPDPIPAQGAGPQFGLGNGDKITLAAPAEIDADGNNLDRIRDLLPLVRQAADDIAVYVNPNQFPELVRDVNAYRKAIEGEPKKIAWGLVFGLGVMLENASLAAERKTLEDPLWPRLEDRAKAAVGSLLTIHGPLILSTQEGRELMAQADEMLLSRENWNALKDDEQIVAGNLVKSPEIIDSPAAAVLHEAVAVMAEGGHPERGTAYGHATFKHAATILVPAATLAAFSAGGALVGDAVGGPIGSAVGGLVGGAATGAGSLIVAERERVRSAARALGSDFDRALGLGRAAMTARLRRLAPFRGFVVANEEPLRRIAQNSTQLRWMLSYIDFVVRPAQSVAHNFDTDGPEWEDDNYWTWQPGNAKSSSDRSDGPRRSRKPKPNR
jgi:hypothetical protein